MCVLLPLLPAAAWEGDGEGLVERAHRGFRDQRSSPVIVTTWRCGHCGELLVCFLIYSKVILAGVKSHMSCFSLPNVSSCP